MTVKTDVFLSGVIISVVLGLTFGSAVIVYGPIPRCVPHDTIGTISTPPNILSTTYDLNLTNTVYCVMWGKAWREKGVICHSNPAQRMPVQ